MGGPVPQVGATVYGAPRYPAWHPRCSPPPGMRTDIIGLGVILAVGGLVYGSSRITAPAATSARMASVGIAPSRDTDLSTRVRSRRHASRQSTALARYVREAAERHQLPESLVAAVISVESEFNPRAVSRRGAIGLMQLMPSTAAMLGVRDAFDPRQNIDGGARHLRDLIDRFSGDVTLALAAYNAGAQNVLKHRGVPPYPETRAFVTRVLHRAGMMATPAVASARTRTVASPAASSAMRPVATLVSAPVSMPGVLLLRHTVEPRRASTSDPAIAPAAFSDGRTAPSASPPLDPVPSLPSEVSAPAALPLNSEAP